MERKEHRLARIEAIRDYVEKAIGRKLLDRELIGLARLNDQDLHLVVAAFDEMS